MIETKTAFLGTPGYVPDPERFNNKDLLKAVGANSGNLMFQLAATRLIGGKLEHVGFSGQPYGSLTVFRGLNYFVFPAANHLRADGAWDLLVGYLKTIRVPLIVLGLGAQADHDGDPTTTAARLRENKSVMALVSLLQDKAKLITTRGAFSEAVCHELGLKDVLRIGCPSQFINPDKTLGAAIETQLSKLKDGEASARIAMTASAPSELQGWRGELEERLFLWTAASSGLYIQQSCEDWFFDGPAGRLADLTPQQISYAHRHVAPSMGQGAFVEALRNAFRIYFDARAWIEDLSASDFAVGTRIHGNMAALAAGRPGVVVTHDARVAELADEMHVPCVDGQIVLDATDYREVLKAVRFDGAAFDAARKKKAALLAAAFARLGVPASEHLQALAA